MPGEKRGEGFHSAAGLIRYFDQEDEKALKIPPWFVVAMAIWMIFLATNICDLGLEAVEWTRQWIAQVGDQPLQTPEP